MPQFQNICDKSLHCNLSYMLEVSHPRCVGSITKESLCRPDAERDGTRAETRIGLSAKRTSPFKSAGGSVQSTAGSRDVRISGSNGSNAGYTVF